MVSWSTQGTITAASPQAAVGTTSGMGGREIHGTKTGTHRAHHPPGRQPGAALRPAPQDPFHDVRASHARARAGRRDRRGDQLLPREGKGGYGGARELLNRTPRPTAIFAGADQAAFGALAAVHEAGLRVPADVSVTGYDNTHLAALPNIALTSVDQGGSVMGAAAGKLLLERIEGRSSAVRFSVTPSLIVRGSTAAPAE